MRNKKEQTEKMSYKSPSTGDFVTGYQYIAEILVKREADREKVILPQRYWNIKGNIWAKKFLLRIRDVCKICEQYTFQAVVKALEREQWAFSLKSKQVLASIKEEQEKLDNLKPVFNQNIENPNSIIENKKKNSLLGKIKNVNKKTDN